MPRGNGEPAASQSGQQSNSGTASPKSHAIGLGSSMDLDSVASGDFDRALRAPLLPSRFAKEDAQQDAQQDTCPAEPAEAPEQPTGNGAADPGHIGKSSWQPWSGCNPVWQGPLHAEAVTAYCLQTQNQGTTTASMQQILAGCSQHASCLERCLVW